MFRVKPRTTLGLIFFTILIQKSEKQWKILSGCLKNLPSGIPEANFSRQPLRTFHCLYQTVPRDWRESDVITSYGFSTTKSDKQVKILRVFWE